MTYKILSTRTFNEILFTEVEYDFDGTIVKVEVAHSMPWTSQDVINGIINRASAEQAKLSIIAALPDVINDLPINQTQNI